MTLRHHSNIHDDGGVHGEEGPGEEQRGNDQDHGGAAGETPPATDERIVGHEAGGDGDHQACPGRLAGKAREEGEEIVNEDIVGTDKPTKGERRARRGTGSVFLRGGVWYAKFKFKGKTYRWSSGSPLKTDATAILD